MITYKDLLVKKIDKLHWDKYWNLVNKTNLLQSWEYAKAKENFFCRPKRYLIKTRENKPIAIVQIIFYGILFLPTIGRINRGPLVLNKLENNNMGSNYYFEVVKAIQLYLKKEMCFLLLISPELDFTQDNLNLFLESGYKSNKKFSWSSSRINLEKDKSEILMSFKSKWRNMLRKSFKLDIFIDSKNVNKKLINQLLYEYKEFKIQKSFKGLSIDLIKSLAKQINFNWKFSVYRAYEKDKSNKISLAGMLVSIIHGSTATYLIAYSNSIGRRLNANYLMLWHAILDAKKSGCNWFDMGGFNENTTKGITHFKKGVKGIYYKNLPEFYKFNIF